METPDSLASGRDPHKVIDEVLAHVPENMIELRRKLKRVQDNTFFCAPECLRKVWLELAHVLSGALPMPPQTDWQKRIFEIVTMKEAPPTPAASG